MLGRFGHVLYWVGCSVGALFLIAAVAGALVGRGEDRLFKVAMFAVIAGLSWITGRACRYVLAGR
jgi:hypothetical protein